MRQNGGMSSQARIALLAQGKLFFIREDGHPIEWKSPFAERVAERHLKIEQKHAWKTQGRGARFMRGGMAWDLPELEPQVPAPVFKGLSLACEQGSLLYSVQVADVQGICRLRRDQGDELRLIHGSDTLPQDLSALPGHDFIAASIPHKDGTAHIGVMDREAGDLRELTEGDTVDLCPSWIPGTKGHLVFQSTGIGRNSSGFIQAWAPSTIQRLDIHTGDLEILLEDEAFDFMAPRFDAEGDLYCIRKPHGLKPSTRRVLRSLLDIVLVPFRLIRAVYHFLNVFSAKYTGKPLRSAGGPKREGGDLKQMWLYGNLIEAQAAGDEARKGEEAPGLVPRSWELIRCKPGQAPEVLATSVLSYCQDGDRLLFSNGNAVFELDAKGEKRKVASLPGIHQILALSPCLP